MAFYNAQNDSTNFVVGWTREPKADFGVFARGYTMAAKRLAGHLLEATRFSDYEAYPVVFLFRHAFELSLKHAIYRAVELAAYKYVEEIDDQLHNTHDVRKLSAAASATLRAVFEGDDYVEDLIQRVATTSNDFWAIDPQSFSYRYPINRDGTRSSTHHQSVNLRALTQHLSVLLEELDTLHFGIGAELYVAQDAALYEAQFELAQDAFYNSVKHELHEGTE